MTPQGSEANAATLSVGLGVRGLGEIDGGLVDGGVGGLPGVNQLVVEWIPDPVADGREIADDETAPVFAHLGLRQARDAGMRDSVRRRSRAAATPPIVA